MQKWEYEIKRIDPSWSSNDPGGVPPAAAIIQDFFNGMGEKGWEFVSFVPPLALKLTLPSECVSLNRPGFED